MTKIGIADVKTINIMPTVRIKAKNWKTARNQMQKRLRNTGYTYSSLRKNRKGIYTGVYRIKKKLNKS